MQGYTNTKLWKEEGKIVDVMTLGAVTLAVLLLGKWLLSRGKLLTDFPKVKLPLGNFQRYVKKNTRIARDIVQWVN